MLDAQNKRDLLNEYLEKQFNPESIAAEQESQDSRQLYANLGRAADTITSGLSGAEQQPTFYNALDKQIEGGNERKSQLAKYLFEKRRLDNAQTRINQADERLKDADKKIDQADKRIGHSKEVLENKKGEFAEGHEYKVEKDFREREVPGFGYAKSKDDAKIAKEQFTNVDKGVTAATKLLEIMDRPFKSVDPKTIGDATIWVAALKGASRIEVTGGGNISGPEQELLNQVAADPTKLWSLDVQNRARLQGVVEKLNLTKKAVIKNYGLVPYGQEKRGGSAPKAAAPKPEMSGDDKQALDWAKKNPNDPRAAQIMQRLGG